MRREMVVSCILAAVLSTAGCGNKEGIDTGASVQTIVHGLSPLTLGGQASVRSFPDGKHLAGPITIDEHGKFEVPLGSASGNMVIEATGGWYEDPVTEKRVWVSDERLHAVARDVESCQVVDVTIGPWSQIVHAFAQKQGLEKSDHLALQLNTVMTAGNSGLRAGVFVKPSNLGNGEDNSTLDASSLAYLFLGAWSELASDLSVQGGFHPGARIKVPHLVRLVSEDISDGKIDGFQERRKIAIADGLALPRDILRQPLAQALRRFAHSPRNRTNIRAEDVADLASVISSDATPALGPRGEDIDTEPPRVTLQGVTAGSVLAQRQELSCQAEDISGIRAMTTQLTLPGSSHPDTSGTISDDLPHQMAISDIIVDPALHGSSGAARLDCTATDRWGQSSTQSVEFHINKGDVAPRVVLSRADADALVGAVDIACVCDSPFTSACSLLRPGPDTRGLSLMRSEPGRTDYRWDTTEALDGHHTISCGLWSHGIATPVETSLQRLVDNVCPSTVRGSVSLGSPVEHVHVRAYVYTDGRKGRLLSSDAHRDFADGRFAIEVSDEYQGPILLEATAAEDGQGAQFFDPAAGQTLAYGHHAHLSLLWEDYVPGTDINHLSINAATSMAEQLATARWRRDQSHDGSTLADTARTARLLVAQHIFSQGAVDLRTLSPADLRRRGEGHMPALQLALFHVGMSKLALRQSLQDVNRWDAWTIMDVLDNARSDLSSGYLDGYSTDLAPIHMGGLQITRDTFRSDLSRLVHEWLTSDRNDRGELLNTSGLEASHLGGRNGFLDTMARNASDLFHGAPGQAFDFEGPVIAGRFLNPDGSAITQPAVTRDRVLLDVYATDISGTRSISASVGGTLLPVYRAFDGTHAVFDVATDQRRDGELEVAIRAEDQVGNTTEATSRIVLDRVAPQLQLDSSRRKGRIIHARSTVDASLLWQTSKPLASVELWLAREEQGFEIVRQWEPGDQSNPFNRPPDQWPWTPLSVFDTLPEEGCYRVKIVGRDRIGNIGESNPLELRMDYHPPRIRLAEHCQDFRTGETTHFSITLEALDSDLTDWEHSLRPTTSIGQKTLDLDIDDNTGRPSGSQRVDLDVKYQYIIHLPSNHDRAETIANPQLAKYWSDPVPIASRSSHSLRPGSGQYVIPYCFFRMLNPRDFCAAKSGPGMYDNIMTQATEEDLQEIRITATDEAGNRSQASFMFKVTIIRP